MDRSYVDNPMDISTFLRNREADLPGVVASARASIGFESADALLAVGSLVEGLGNRKSDLDLILVTPRKGNVLSSRELTLLVGRCLVDVELLSRHTADELLVRFNRWSALPWDTTYAPDFSPEDRRLLHRLQHHLVLFEGESSNLAALEPGRDRLARLKLQVARHLSRTIQIDIAGNREAGDFMTMVFAAQELLGHAVDALAAGHYLTNPTAKWRSRILGLVPSDWEQALRVRQTGLRAPDLFWLLHRAPERAEAELALAHALRIATFARAVFVWAERRLVRQVPDPSGPFKLPRVERAPGDSPLPHLDLDVDFLESDGRVALGRLNELEDRLELSVCDFELTRFFDGVSTAREATLAVFGADASEADRHRVDNLVSRVARAGFAVPEPGPLGRRASCPS